MTCPFGPKLAHYWERLSARERSMMLDEEGLYSLALQEVMDQITPNVRADSVLDPFCGCGGSAIAFARAGKKVVAIDSDPDRIEMSQHNAALYGVEGLISFKCGDALAAIRESACGAVFLDPPWGGPDYSKKEKFLLADFSPSGAQLLGACLAKFIETVLRVPKNFDFEQLVAFDREYGLQENVFDKKIMHYTVYFSQAPK